MANEEFKELELTENQESESTDSLQEKNDNRVAFLRVKIGSDPNKASSPVETVVDFTDQNNEFSIDESSPVESFDSENLEEVELDEFGGFLD